MGSRDEPGRGRGAAPGLGDAPGQPGAEAVAPLSGAGEKGRGDGVCHRHPLPPPPSPATAIATRLPPPPPALEELPSGRASLPGDPRLVAPTLLSSSSPTPRANPRGMLHSTAPGTL